MEEILISDLVTGDDYDFDIFVSDVPSGQTVVSGWLGIKNYDTDTDYVILKNVGTSLTSAGLVNVSGSYTRVYISLSSTETRLLNSRAEYTYDISILTSALKHKTVEIGTIQPVQDITRL